MSSLRELRRKVKSFKSTQQITRAMKLVAAARLTRAQERIVAARPFADRMGLLLQELSHLVAAGRAETSNQPFLVPRAPGKRIDLVLVTSDRGLCGSFNSVLIRRAVQFLRDHPNRDVRLWCVGRKGRDFFRRIHRSIEREYVNVFQRLSYAQADIIGTDLIKAYRESDTSAVLFLYNEFKSRLQQKLTLHQIFPIQEPPPVAPKTDFLYEPDREALLTELIPRYVKAQIYRILLESQSAELAARMSAMDSATNNAKEIIFSLTITMNKVRQAAITKEISEIVSGAEALQN